MTEEKPEVNYCTTLDVVYQKKPEFVGMILEQCLSRVFSTRSVIVPTDAEIKKIKAIKDEAKQKLALMNYILYPLASPEALREREFVVTIKGYRYMIKKDGDKILLNDVAIKEDEHIGQKYIYFAADTLKPLEPEEKKKEGGECPTCKTTEKTVTAEEGEAGEESSEEEIEEEDEVTIETKKLNEIPESATGKRELPKTTTTGGAVKKKGKIIKRKKLLKKGTDTPIVAEKMPKVVDVNEEVDEEGLEYEGEGEIAPTTTGGCLGGTCGGDKKSDENFKDFISRINSGGDVNTKDRKEQTRKAIQSIFL